MPATRRSSRGGRPSGKQATLSFNHRVTKSVPKASKDLVSISAQSPLAKHVLTHTESEDEVVDVQVDEKVQTSVDTPTEVEVEVEPERVKTEAELRADKITEKQVSQYWRGIEHQRRTSRLHQGDLSLAEKILRYWDVSSQYGVCLRPYPISFYMSSVYEAGRC
ncbi:hypothetical protein F4808DRAFT_419222 [Astrocystis sublimbata]|nr:hypothetical protein F4808DRAFT_419222 [Astrocystis sublimbata]